MISGIFKKLRTIASKSTETVYRAAEDGFVLLKSNYATNGNVDHRILSDVSNPPTTEIAKITNNWNGVDLSLEVAVKKGDYWKSTCSNTAKSPAYLYWRALR